MACGVAGVLASSHRRADRFGSGTADAVEAFANDVLPQLAAAVDFAGMRLISVSADGDHVAALLTTCTLSGEELWIAEHRTLWDGKL